MHATLDLIDMVAEMLSISTATDHYLLPYELMDTRHTQKMTWNMPVTV